MKKMLFTLVLFVLSSAATFAGQRNSDLKLTVFQNQSFLLNLDGYRYSRPADQVILRDLDPGRHYLEVFSACGTRTLFRGYINLQPSSQIKARIDARGQFVISHIVLKQNGYSYGPPAQGTVIYTGHGVGAVSSPGTCGTPNQPFGYYTGQPAGSSAMILMPANAFKILIRTLEDQRFEESRLAIARDALRRNAFTALQLREMVYTMSFEESRLEVARLGYPSLVDPQNVYLVTEAFRFSGTTNELYAWIGR